MVILRKPEVWNYCCRYEEVKVEKERGKLQKEAGGISSGKKELGKRLPHK